MNYFFLFVVAFILSVVFTKIVKSLANKFKILDYPEKDPGRKIHRNPIPLLGGVGLYFSFFLSLILIILLKIWPSGPISFKHLFGVFIGSTILIIGGVLDEKKNLKPVFQLLFSVLAILTVIAFGIGIKYINHPFGQGLLFLEQTKIELFEINGIPYYFSWPADLITFIWLLLVIYATKLLAGLDGLVPGVTAIGAATIIGFCLFTIFYQPQVAFLAIILLGISLGFLVFNFHPAKIFLGTSGETFLGFLLGVLAIISGSKIATLLLVLGIPILDLIWVVLRRILKEKQSPMMADRKHLHHRLLDFGFSHQGAVIFLWILALMFGLTGIFFPTTKIKILILGILIVTMIGLAILLTKKKVAETKKSSLGSDCGASNDLTKTG